LAKYNLALVAVREVRWDKGGNDRAEIIHISAEI